MISCTDQNGMPSNVTEGEFDLKIKWIRGYFGALTASPLRPSPKSPIGKDRQLITSGPLNRNTGPMHTAEAVWDEAEFDDL